MEQPTPNNVYQQNQAIARDERMAGCITDTLLNLGFRPTLKGFVYLKEAIFLYYKKSIVSSIFSDIYSIIAEKYHVTVMSIDRSIKKSIDDAWYNRGMNPEHELFECPCIRVDVAPTNSTFIAMLAEILKYRVI